MFPTSVVERVPVDVVNGGALGVIWRAKHPHGPAVEILREAPVRMKHGIARSPVHEVRIDFLIGENPLKLQEDVLVNANLDALVVGDHAKDFSITGVNDLTDVVEIVAHGVALGRF